MSENIYNRAKNGTLQEDDLKGPKFDINYFDNEDQTTPLGIAVRNKHFKAVQILLNHKADPKADPDCLGKGLSPLLFLCGSRRTKENVEERLIQLLLDHGAKANPSPDVPFAQGWTPLMKAVHTRKSTDIIKYLVDHGADPDVKGLKSDKDNKGKSANDLAKSAEMKNALRKRSQRLTDRILEVGKVTGFLLTAVYWVNKNLMVAAAVAVTAGAVMVAKDAIWNRFRMTGSIDKRLKKHIPEDKGFDDAKDEEKQDLTNRMNEVIKEYDLDRFFPKGDPFLGKLVERAVNLDQTNPSNSLDPKDLTHLALYQPVLYCDDSGSMKTGERRDHQNELVKRIASITTRVVPDENGIELRFINAKTTHDMSRPSLEVIDSIMKRVQSNGWTEIGTHLRTKVLEENVYQPLKNNRLSRPVLISIITDGDPSGPGHSPERDDTLKIVIQECGEKLKSYGFSEKVVRFQVSQIGDDKKAKKFLKILDEDLELKDVLYVTSDRLDTQFKSLHTNGARLEQWLIELLMGPIIDAQGSES
ncbi:uncharacterized protein N7483_002776 [Penicillium malachiteum]|uniref:uncharacterized protein n=1 Tax=Penicillium malachiteum TaxID=1324776 RepID=UPI002549C0DC|nr:uncharacterized protein N7483_002776 [Penicillium malachiteum]KAJ5737651.1 hypothetical protein N7483_002776 [Penicillium malachiteum]